MKKIITLIVLSIVISTISCDKCEEGDRATPASFFVAIVDAATNENVFENETFLPTQIVIKDLDDKLVPFRFIPNSNLIQIFPNTQKFFFPKLSFYFITRCKAKNIYLTFVLQQ